MLALSTRHLRGVASSLEESLAPLARLGYRDLFLGLRDVGLDAGSEPASPPRDWRIAGVTDYVTRRESRLCADPVAEGLSSFDEGARRSAVTSLLGRAAAARALSAPLVVTRLGAVDVPAREEREWKASRDPGAAAEFLLETRSRANRALEIACRSVHEIVRAEPDVTFAIENPAFGYELGFPDDMARLFGEVRARNLAAWYSTGAGDLAFRHGLGPEPAAFLECAASRLAGMFLSDADGAVEGIVPGRGRVDFRMAAFFLPRRAHRALFLAPGGAAADIFEATAFLKDRGIA